MDVRVEGEGSGGDVIFDESPIFFTYAWVALG